MIFILGLVVSLFMTWALNFAFQRGEGFVVIAILVIVFLFGVAMMITSIVSFLRIYQDTESGK